LKTKEVGFSKVRKRTQDEASYECQTRRLSAKSRPSGWREGRSAIGDKKSTTPGPSFTRRGIIGPTNHVPPVAVGCLPPTADCPLPTAFSLYARYSFIMLIYRRQVTFISSLEPSCSSERKPVKPMAFTASAMALISITPFPMGTYSRTVGSMSRT